MYNSELLYKTTETKFKVLNPCKVKGIFITQIQNQSHKIKSRFHKMQINMKSSQQIMVIRK